MQSDSNTSSKPNGSAALVHVDPTSDVQQWMSAINEAWKKFGTGRPLDNGLVYSLAVEFAKPVVPWGYIDTGVDKITFPVLYVMAKRSLGAV